MEISIDYSLLKLILRANRLYARQENMNLTLTLLNNVTKVWEKWKTLFIVAKGYSPSALFLDILLLGRMLHMLSLKPLSAFVIVASYPFGLVP